MPLQRQARRLIVGGDMLLQRHQRQVRRRLDAQLPRPRRLEQRQGLVVRQASDRPQPLASIQPHRSKRVRIRQLPQRGRLQTRPPRHFLDIREGRIPRRDDPIRPDFLEPVDLPHPQA